MRRRLLLLLLILPALAVRPAAFGAPPAVSVAAAANLVFALDALNAEFRRAHPGVTVTPTVGASGSLFAQIRNGAPFDVFLSADTEYPHQVVASGLGAKETLRVFAVGRLAVWTTRPGLDLDDLGALARGAAVRKIALAQPALAPYGRAAQEVLRRTGAWRDAEPKLVFGESISQTAQFVETGNADLGFVALSLVRSPRLAGRGHWREIAPELHPGVPLDHGVVLTTRGAANPAARLYLEFLASEPAKARLREFGYGTP